MLLNDMRDVFNIALLSLGYSPQDRDPKHIQHAYQALVELAPNIKFFANEGIQALMIDGDALLGTAWNGDAFKAHNENANLNFIFPKEGFVIWMDCLAIPKNAPHPDNAYIFINYMLRPEVAAQIALQEGHAITNKDGRRLLPEKIRTNQNIYP